MTNSTFLVVSDANAIKIGIVSADGGSLSHALTLDAIKGVAHYDRAHKSQAEDLAVAMGGAWIVDTDGDTRWQS